MKATSMVIVPIAFFCIISVNCSFAQEQVSVVKSVPITIGQVAAPVPIVATGPITVDKVNTPVKVTEDNTLYTLTYMSKIVTVSQPGPGLGASQQAPVQAVLDDAAKYGWELVTTTAFRNVYDTVNSSTSTQILLIFRKKTLNP